MTRRTFAVVVAVLLSNFFTFEAGRRAERRETAPTVARIQQKLDTLDAAVSTVSIASLAQSNTWSSASTASPLVLHMATPKEQEENFRASVQAEVERLLEAEKFDKAVRDALMKAREREMRRTGRAMVSIDPKGRRISER